MMGIQPQDLEFDLIEAHDRVCHLGKNICNADLRVIAARALRRAYLGEVCMAYLSGELSEGQAAELLGFRADRVGMREILYGAVGRAEAWWQEHRKTNKPLAHNAGPQGD